MKHNHSVSGATVRAPIQQACDLPTQRGGNSGLWIKAIYRWRAASSRTMAAVASAEWSSTTTITQAAYRIILPEQGLQAAPDIGFLVARRNDHGKMRRLLAGWWRRGDEARQQPALPHRAQDQPRHDRKPD
jgi:hypothetical protein